MMASKQIKKRKNTESIHRETIQAKKAKTIWTMLAKMIFLIVVVLCAIAYTDRKGWFAPDSTNNHTQRKWDSYYQFTQQYAVDIVMVGNSHLYAGINPQHLSCALGANCFILAAPGTTITDAYYCLKEAVAVCRPKIAVIETYGISDDQTHEFSDGQLSDQLQSFHARKNIGQKLWSTPALFRSEHYLAAWSNTIRNHSYLLKDRDQIEKNIRYRKIKTSNELYLGQFVSFPTGMTDSTLQKYDIPGIASIADGNTYRIGDEARHYVRKIMELCQAHDIQPIFLTIPMYHRHINNYDVWKGRLADALAPYRPTWIDLQSPYDHNAFTPECFENSVKSNQHLSYHGSLVATYKLANYIHTNFQNILHDRSTDQTWHQLFYGKDGYFENHSPKPDDSLAHLLLGRTVFPTLTIKELILCPNKEYNLLMIKIDKLDMPNLRKEKLNLLVDAKMDGQQIIANIDAEIQPTYDPPNHFLFISYIKKDVEILGVRNAEIIKTEEHISSAEHMNTP